MTISLAWGERIALSRVDAFADGVAVKQVRGRRVDAEGFRSADRVVVK